MGNLQNYQLLNRQSLIILFDVLISILATYFAFSLRLETYHIPKYDDIYIYLVCVLTFLPIYILFGIYNSLVKYINLYSIIRIALATIIYSFVLFIIFSFYQYLIKIDFFFDFKVISISRSIAIIQPIIFCFIICLVRVIFTQQSNNLSKQNSPNILIYGAGNAGSQLLDSIQKNGMFNVMAFVDDDEDKYKKFISGIQIFSQAQLDQIIPSKKIQMIIIAIPSLKMSKRRSLVKNLKKYNIETKILPDIRDLLDNNISINDIKILNIDDLLEREIEKVDSNKLELMSKKKVLVSGAGGSIGSELCKQILSHNPGEIILLDHSEFNLYKILEELEKISLRLGKKVSLVPILLSVNNFNGLENLFKIKLPDIIFHAAAYKHVNLVQKNVIESVRNNFFGTLNMVKLAKKFNVENFVLISSDKAVRPTNIMGATKRLSELIVQAFANNETKNSKKIIFSIVRFGNVLASSGSVINKFNEQIKNREALTVTHEEVTRYFMTIYEAVYLILQAYKISKGGEVFLLDMGKPIKIIDLAKKMVKLSGLTIVDKDNVYGDIAIKIVGLRPGEKLYEELLIDENSTPSKNKNIFYAKEEFIELDKLYILAKKLEENADKFNRNKVIEVLEEYVVGFKYKN
jgi:FlaA1/EpsC-like NDP-sugar epimerase